MRRCDANEHYYDENKHSSCPFCTGARDGGDKTVVYGGGNKPSGTVKLNSSAKEEDIPQNTVIPEAKPTSQTPSSSEPKTVGVWGRKKAETKSEYTKSSNSVAYSEAPVVGWLVVVEGNNKGQDFRIIPGINSIGRCSSNTINLDTGDQEISREKHCIIEFDYKNSGFYLERGTTTTYLNGGRVGGDGKELNIGDVIEVGNTKLKFIPLCTAEFCWEL